MDNSLLKKYDKVFFGSDRMGNLIDELLNQKEEVKVYLLAEMLCSYIHFRVNYLVNNSDYKTINLKIDAKNLPKKVKESDVFEGIVYLVDRLELENVSINKKQNYCLTIY